MDSNSFASTNSYHILILTLIINNIITTTTIANLPYFIRTASLKDFTYNTNKNDNNDDNTK